MYCAHKHRVAGFICHKQKLSSPPSMWFENILNVGYFLSRWIGDTVDAFSVSNASKCDVIEDYLIMAFLVFVSVHLGLDLENGVGFVFIFKSTYIPYNTTR